MANWRNIYRDKIVSVEQAVNQVKSGDKVCIAHGCAEPKLLVKALMDRAPELEGVEIIHMIAFGPALYAQPEFAKSFRHNSFFLGGTTRKAAKELRADFSPCHFSQIPVMFKQGYIKLDVAMLNLSMPDEDGRCSFGTGADYSVSAAASAKLVIAQINHQMPRTGGASISLADIDWVTEVDDPLYEIQPPTIGEVERAIGGHVASLIKDGDTLQLGIGAIPDAVLSFLTHKKDLGIHTEMFSDGVVDLARAGVVTNQAKTLNKGKFIACNLFGTKKLYDFVHNNPDVEIHPTDYTNDVSVIAQNDNLVSINSAIQVDLTGQVNAEMLGSEQYSGIGGQVDFVRGSFMSRNGRSIIALPSTAAGGKISRIVCRLDEGACVTTSRTDVHYIATEYGIVCLRGKSLRERAEALIAIAHPDFREALRTQAKSLNIIGALLEKRPPVFATPAQKQSE